MQRPQHRWTPPYIYPGLFERDADTDTGKNWAFVVYAHVLVQMTEDLDQSGTEHQANAIKWYSCELYEVAIVCAICLENPRDVYREVARRLRRVEGTRSSQRRQIRIIRCQLASGQKLHEITVPLAEPHELVAA